MSRNLTLDNPIHFYAPITRVDPETRIVTGYCYVNPKVKGDKWNLKRAAMEAAGVEYMKAPAIRSMHRADVASGLGMSIEWDEKGCKISAEIVDDQEWRKVEKKVYRGFSIGGRPLIVRGNDVESFEWQETSLVDRPADPAALFCVGRADNSQGQYEVEVIEEEAEAEQGETHVNNGEQQADGGRAAGSEPGEPEQQGVLGSPPAAGDGETGEAAQAGISPDSDSGEEDSGRGSLRCDSTEGAGSPTGDTKAVAATGAGDSGREEASRLDVAPELERGQTSETAPSRENLEGGKADKRKVKRLTHYSCGSGECHGHVTRGGAYECMLKRGEVTADEIQRFMKIEGELVVSTFADSIASLKEQRQWNDVQAATEQLRMSLLFAGNNAEARHQSVDEFADYMHTWVETVDDENFVNGLNSLPTIDSSSPDVGRLERIEAENQNLLQRAQNAENEVLEVRGDLEIARRDLSNEKEETARLRNVKLGQKQVVRYPTIPLERGFSANSILGSGSDTQARRAELESEKARIVEANRNESDDLKRQENTRHMIRVEAELNRLPV